MVFDSANAYSPDMQPEIIKIEKESVVKNEEPQHRINPFLVPSNSTHDEEDYNEDQDRIEVQQVVRFF